VKDSNFLKEKNARSLWHPMAHPADSLANPPTIVTGAEGVSIIDVDGHKVVDGVGGLWNVNLGFSCQPIKDAIAAQLEQSTATKSLMGSAGSGMSTLASHANQSKTPLQPSLSSSPIIPPFVARPTTQ